jgi:hypothetical protein
VRRFVQIARGALIVAPFALAVAGAAQTPFPFDRYQVILQRKPFGNMPAPEPPPPPPQPQGESFAKSLRLSMIVDVNDGETMKVGFVDTRTGRSYLLMPGESQDGIEVVSASWKDEEAILKHGSEMALIKIASGEVRAIGPGQPAPPGAAAPAPTAVRPTWEERRRARAAPPPPPEPPPPPKFTGAELERHLQEYQLEVIRQGLPPLPIPLTPEMDARLVAEGILPPR